MAARDIKVGVFVLVSLLVLGAIVFLIGDEAQLFEEHTEVKTAFTDVQGLNRGSPVRMGGVDIGQVTHLGYASDPKDQQIYVRMSVVEDEAARIRTDSVASVEGKGLLGDKMVVITVGSPDKPRVPEGELIASEESRDMQELIADLKKAAGGAERVIQNLEKTTNAFADETFTGDVKDAVNHLSSILQSMNEGDGYVGRLLHDPAEAENLSKTVTSVRQSSQELERLLASTRSVVERVRSGPGFAHEVIYEESGSKALSQIGGAAEEVGLALKGVRQGDSFAHSVLYDSKSAEVMENLNRASADISHITRDLRQGKGTLGAFLVDPSVYEDVKVLLGNTGRNRSLRALVRYSIRQEEEAGRVQETTNMTSASDTAAGGGAASAAAAAGR